MTTLVLDLILAEKDDDIRYSMLSHVRAGSSILECCQRDCTTKTLYAEKKQLVLLAYNSIRNVCVSGMRADLRSYGLGEDEVSYYERSFVYPLLQAFSSALEKVVA